jgi:hypothetical protein
MTLEGQCVCGHKRCVLTEGCATREASLTGCESAGQCDNGDDCKSMTERHYAGHRSQACRSLAMRSCATHGGNDEQEAIRTASRHRKKKPFNSERYVLHKSAIYPKDRLFL